MKRLADTSIAVTCWQCLFNGRFATENSVFFVPEATLGLGLAGGLSYVLPRLLGGNQPLALCLALTGMALEGPDLFFAQLATNYMTHRRLDMMTERLAEVGGISSSRGGHIAEHDIGRYLLIETVLELVPNAPGAANVNAVSVAMRLALKW